MTRCWLMLGPRPCRRLELPAGDFGPPVVLLTWWKGFWED